MDSEFEDACAAAQIPDGGTRMVEISGRDVLLSRFGAEVFAVGGECTHAFASLIDARVSGRHITCSRHGAMFDLSTGKSLSGACPDLPRFQVRVERGRVLVRRR